MIQILLHNLKMDPLVSLHYYAPVCAIINLFFLPFTEGLEPFYQLKDLGVFILVSNAAVAFLLNVAAVFLVGVASSLVLTLSGVFKVRLWLSFLFSPFVFRFSLPLNHISYVSFYSALVPSMRSYHMSMWIHFRSSRISQVPVLFCFAVVPLDSWNELLMLPSSLSVLAPVFRWRHPNNQCHVLKP